MDKVQDKYWHKCPALQECLTVQQRTKLQRKSAPAVDEQHHGRGGDLVRSVREDLGGQRVRAPDIVNHLCIAHRLNYLRP